MTTFDLLNLSILIIGCFISCALITIANDINLFRKDFNKFLDAMNDIYQVLEELRLQNKKSNI